MPYLLHARVFVPFGAISPLCACEHTSLKSKLVLRIQLRGLVVIAYLDFLNNGWFCCQEHNPDCLPGAESAVERTSAD